jgi:hypothetical protein
MINRRVILSIYLGMGKAIKYTYIAAVSLFLFVFDSWALFYGLYLRSNDSEIPWSLALYVPLRVLAVLLAFFLLIIVCVIIGSFFNRCKELHYRFVEWCAEGKYDANR